MLITPSPSEIAQYEVTDHCNWLTKATLKALNLGDVEIAVEAAVRSFPKGVRSAFFYGKEDIRNLLASKGLLVECIEDGAVFREREPVLTITGAASQIALIRTALTGTLTFYCSLITRMAEYTATAAPHSIHFFGLRKIHPSHSLQYLLCAYIAGLEIDATQLSSKIIRGLRISDCQEHLTNTVADSVEESWRAFLDLPATSGALYVVLDNASDPIEEVSRLVKTFGSKICGVLLDLDSTRRGHLPRIIEELHWTLKLLDRSDIRVFLTGGVTLEVIRQTHNLVSGYGIGISALQAPLLDFSFQIVEVKGEPKSKLGVFGGKKNVFVCGNCLLRKIDLASARHSCCGRTMEAQLNPFNCEGVFDDQDDRRSARDRLLNHLNEFDEFRNKIDQAEQS